ncbi:MAG: hypothetical protein KC619_27775 [Myxococcales bacterium]|nr:hypothetical protein [Myxococcales bacterium]
MQADDYEREHMRIDGAVRFRDRYSSKLGFAMAAGLPVVIGGMVAFELQWGVVAFMSVVGALGVAVDLALSSYRVVLTSQTLHVQHGLRHERIPVAAIEAVTVAPHRMGHDRLFGRGPYEQSLDGSVRRYRKEGMRETVRIEWRLHGRRRTTIIGTDRAEELAEALRRAGRTEHVAVRVADGMAEALDEVEALLRPEAGATRRR